MAGHPTLTLEPCEPGMAMCPKWPPPPVVHEVVHEGSVLHPWTSAEPRIKARRTRPSKIFEKCPFALPSEGLPKAPEAK